MVNLQMDDDTTEEAAELAKFKSLPLKESGTKEEIEAMGRFLDRAMRMVGELVEESEKGRRTRFTMSRGAILGWLRVPREERAKVIAALDSHERVAGDLRAFTWAAELLTSIEELAT